MTVAIIMVMKMIVMQMIYDDNYDFSDNKKITIAINEQ